ncbi:MAG: hypothetical protein KKA07_09745 [Bacteroidetes bacterium]|nr:hypothetical protein [Bacteroidota bacterium]MBU1719343.1 hypothetical protein [Bacteroidota bacterium]
MRHLFMLLCSTLVLNAFSQNVPTEREMNMVDEINLVRTNPKAYIPFVYEYLNYWEADESVRKVGDELIRELKKMKPLDSLQFSQKLYDGAVAHDRHIMRKFKLLYSCYIFSNTNL